SPLFMIGSQPRCFGSNDPFSHPSSLKGHPWSGRMRSARQLQNGDEDTAVVVALADDQPDQSSKLWTFSTVLFHFISFVFSSLFPSLFFYLLLSERGSKSPPPPTT